MVDPPLARLPLPIFGGVVDHRAGHAGIVDAVMLEEGLVLGGQEGADEQGRIFGVAQLDPALAGVAVDRDAVDAADVGGQRGLIGPELFDRGEIPGEDQP